MLLHFSGSFKSASNVLGFLLFILYLGSKINLKTTVPTIIVNMMTTTIAKVIIKSGSSVHM